MKMATIVGIFIFISRESFMLKRVEQEKSFINSGPEHSLITVSLFDIYPAGFRHIS